MKFGVATIILIKYIIASKLSECPKDSVNPRYNSTTMNEDLTCCGSPKRSLTFSGKENIEDIKTNLELYKNTIEELQFFFVSSNHILEILEICALYLQNAIELRITSSRIDSTDQPAISDSFNNLKVSSLYLRNANLNSNLTKAIFNLLIKNKRIKLLEISSYRFDDLESIKDIISILNNEEVHVDLLRLSEISFKDNNIFKTLLDSMKNNERLKSVYIKNHIFGYSNIYECFLEFLKECSILPDFEYYVVNAKTTFKQAEYCVIKKDAIGKKLFLDFNDNNFDNYMEILDAIASNSIFKKKEIVSPRSKFFYHPICIVRIFTIPKDFKNVFKKLAANKILIPIDQWLSQEQQEIMKNIQKELLVEKKEISDEYEIMETIYC